MRSDLSIDGVRRAPRLKHHRPQMQLPGIALLFFSLWCSASRAGEPVNTEPPCKKVAIQLNDGRAPILVADSYFTYHFDYSLSALRRLEALATIESCSAIVQKLGNLHLRRKDLRELAEASPEPYRKQLLQELDRPQTPSAVAWGFQSLTSEHGALVQRAITTTEACAALWGGLSNSQSDNFVTASNRIRVELPQCVGAPTKTFRQPP
jgi:hypothetical protein